MSSGFVKGTGRVLSVAVMDHVVRTRGYLPLAVREKERAILGSLSNLPSCLTLGLWLSGPSSDIARHRHGFGFGSSVPVAWWQPNSPCP